MYNQATKEEYMNSTVQDDASLTELFDYTQEFEEKFNKDLKQFKNADMSKLFKSVNITDYKRLRLMLNTIKKYQLYNNKCLNTYNVLNLLQDKNDVNLEGVALNEGDIDIICGNLINIFDQVIIRSIYEGIQGFGRDDLTVLTLDHLEPDTLTVHLPLRRIDIKVSARLMDAMIEATQTNVAYSGNGERAIYYIPGNEVMRRIRSGEIKSGRLRTNLSRAMIRLGINNNISISVLRHSGIANFTGKQAGMSFRDKFKLNEDKIQKQFDCPPTTFKRTAKYETYYETLTATAE